MDKPQAQGYFPAWPGFRPPSPNKGTGSCVKANVEVVSKFRDLLSILLGKRSMTSNDFREDGWQRPNEEAGALKGWGRGWVQVTLLLALINPRGQGPGRTGGHLKVGFS